MGNMVKYIILKIILYPKYKLLVFIKFICSLLDWEISPLAADIYMKLIEPISFYRCLHIHCKYESFLSILKQWR